jgi:hypothetical protein
VFYCTIAAASFTCGVWFARAALPPVNHRAESHEGSALAESNHVSERQFAPLFAKDDPTGAASGTEAPPLDVTWSTGELQDRYRALAAQAASGRLELARLQQRIESVGPVPPASSNPSPSSQPIAATVGRDDRDPLKATFYPPNPEELTELAKNCTVRVDHPKVLDSTPGEVGSAAEEMNATPDEVRSMNEEMRALHASFRDRLRELYAEATGHAADTELSPRAMLGELQDKKPPQNADLLTSIAKERAGELPAPTNLGDSSAYERAERMYLALGDEFQQQLASRLGPERASALRAASGGWVWSRSQFTGCRR